MTTLRTGVDLGLLNENGREYLPGYLGTVQDGSIACTAVAQHLGYTTQVWDAVVSKEATGRKLALFRCTQKILWPTG